MSERDQILVDSGVLEFRKLVVVVVLRWDSSVTVLKAIRGGLAETAIPDASFGEDGGRVWVHGWKLK